MWRYDYLDNDNSPGFDNALQDYFRAGWEPFSVTTRNARITPEGQQYSVDKQIDRIHLRIKLD